MARSTLRILLAMTMTIGTTGAARAQSAADGFNPGANNVVHAIVVQPDGGIVVGGAFTTLAGQTRNGLGRLNADGSLDVTFNPSGSGDVYALALQSDGKILVGRSSTLSRLNASGSVDGDFSASNYNTFSVGVRALAVQSDGKIVVGGSFTMLNGSARSSLARLNGDGSVDTGFNTGVTDAAFIPGLSDTVFALAVQPDGKILVGGHFSTLGGEPRRGFGRLNASGALDTAFDANVGSGSEVVTAVAVQSDGKILIGGSFELVFNSLVGVQRHNIGRVHANGSPDVDFDPGANGLVRSLAIQPDGQILLGGGFSTAGGGGTGMEPRNGVARLNRNGGMGAPFPSVNGEVYAVAVQPDGNTLVGGAFTTLSNVQRNRIGRVNLQGWADGDFNPGVNGPVYGLAVQPDGRVLVGGSFSTLGGAAVNNLGRVISTGFNGVNDSSFNAGANGVVNAIALQADGKILVGGSFSTLGGGGTGTGARNNIGRLNADGSLDTSFNPGTNGVVNSIVVQPDGRILVGGGFSMLGGGSTGTVARSRLGRLNADGTLDAGFNPGANSVVYALSVQADGRILVGGLFTTLGGGGTGAAARQRIGRLNGDGSLDGGFNPGANDAVHVFLEQPGGTILVAGNFTGLGGGTGTTVRRYIGRLNADGSVDGFNPGANNFILTVAAQADGKIVVGGQFTMLGGGGTGTAVRNRLGRLNADGSIDVTFNADASHNVQALAVQDDGKIIAAGDFTTLAGASRSRIGRLATQNGATGDLNATECGTVLTWFRGGAAPELSRVAFESSNDGVSYAPLGNGGRIDGGWRLSGLSLSTDANVFIRARGYGQTGYLGGSGSRFESVRQAYVPLPVIPPTTLTPGTVGVPYSRTISATGGLGALAYTHSGQPLPAGIAFNNGTYSGTPTQAGVFPSAVLVSDPSSGCVAQRSVTVTIACQAITLGATSFTAATAGSAYASTPISQSGAIGTTTFAVSSGALPAGMTVSSAGTLSGTPTATGTFNFTVTATDANACSGARAYSITSGCPTIAVSNTSFSNATAGASYPSTTITQTGGVGAIGFSVTSGALPAGMTLSGTGAVGGTPTATGTFNFTVTATDANACTGVRAYSITSGCPTITLSNTSFSSATIGAAYPSTTITQTGGIGATAFSMTSGALPAGMTLSSTGAVSGTPTALGTFNFTVTATDANGCTGTRAYTISVTGGVPSITAQPQSQTAGPGQTISFTAVASGNPVPTYQWQVSADAGSTWTDLTNTAPYADVATATLKITPAALGLNGRRYRAIATNSAGSATSSAATLTVAEPQVTLDRTSLAFTAVTTGAAFSSNTGMQSIRLTQNGPGTLTWTASSNAPWLTVSPASGSGSATLNVSVQIAAGLATTQTAAVTLTLTGAANSAGPVTVTLRTTAAGNAPTGLVDTPIEGSTGISGSIGVTGWAIDDVQVVRVTICRDPVSGETVGPSPHCNNLAKVYIGDGVFVEGARTDIAAANPNAPLSSRAGWGYLMLTNFLPARGNGTFTLHAFASDADGHTTLLGTRTITCDNNASLSPFGAIDTPGQGEVISGATYPNFGWVLSPGSRRADVPGGGTVTALVDGVNVGTPGEWGARGDLASLFPASGYSGIGSALAVLNLDTTALSNGVHTIAWVVTANDGRAAGVGSRFFSVSNGALVLEPAQAASRRMSRVIPAPAILSAPDGAPADPRVLAALVEEAPVATQPVQARRGFDLGSPLQSYRPSAGRVVLQAEEVDRVEVRLRDVQDQQYTGYLRTGAGIAPLPAGSTLDAGSGTFTWMPGVGFVGVYDFVFVRWAAANAIERQEVRIVLNAKGSNRTGMQVMIDEPVMPPNKREGAVVHRQFFMGGWAADLDAAVDAGVRTVHVWAYPAAGGAPQFVGMAHHGGARPDVAGVYGDRFRNSGFGIVVDGLAPGTYDLAVFAASSVTGRFAPAKVARVTIR